MKYFRKTRKHLVDQHIHSEEGAVTIEAVLWIPFFLGLFGLLADVSMVFYNQSRLLRVVQDANRSMSIGRLKSVDDVKRFITTGTTNLSSHVTSNTSVTAGVITTTATVPMSDLDLFGVAGVFRNAKMTVRAEHLMEM